MKTRQLLRAPQVTAPTSGSAPCGHLNRRRWLGWGLVSGFAPLATPVRACEFFTRTLRVIHPWTRATGDDERSATVCMQFDDVTEDERLIGVQCAFAQGAEMAGVGSMGGTQKTGPVDFAIPKGQRSQLSEHGTFLRLLQLQHPLEVGRSYPIQLQFEKSGLLRADLTVDFTRFR